jgi:predicted membrane chloride channel (bestrophin family)
MLSFPKSRIVKKTQPMLAVLIVWSLLANAWNAFLPRFAVRLPLPVVALLSSFVAFVLTLRTNHSLSRLLEGRLAWGRTVLLTRDLSQQL